MKKNEITAAIYRIRREIDKLQKTRYVTAERDKNEGVKFTLDEAYSCICSVLSQLTGRDKDKLREENLDRVSKMWCDFCEEDIPVAEIKLPCPNNPHTHKHENRLPALLDMAMGNFLGCNASGRLSGIRDLIEKSNCVDALREVDALMPFLKGATNSDAK